MDDIEKLSNSFNAISNFGSDCTPPSQKLAEPEPEDNFNSIKESFEQKVSEPNNYSQQSSEYRHVCCICLERINERAKPDICQHTFCLDCIFGWTKHHNVCPLCKREINELEKFDALENSKVIERIKVEKPPDENEEQPVMPESLMDQAPLFAECCYKCKKNDNEDKQIVCEYCEYEIAHYECLGFTEVPEEEWICEKCTKKLER